MLKLTVEDLEKERDFYFGKLRNIELICQENEGENDPVLQRIVEILYATDVSDLPSPILPLYGKLPCFFYFLSTFFPPLNLWPDTTVIVRPQAWLGSPEQCLAHSSELKKASWVVGL